MGLKDSLPAYIERVDTKFRLQLKRIEKLESRIKELERRNPNIKNRDAQNTNAIPQIDMGVCSLENEQTITVGSSTVYLYDIRPYVLDPGGIWEELYAEGGNPGAIVFSGARGIQGERFFTELLAFYFLTGIDYTANPPTPLYVIWQPPRDCIEDTVVAAVPTVSGGILGIEIVPGLPDGSVL